MVDRKPSNGESLLLRIAADVSDRAPVDWDGARGDAPELLGTIGWLRRLQGLAEVHERGGEPSTPDAVDPLQEPPHLTHWGALQILEALGQGGFGHVYRAYEPSLDRDVALKLWHRRPGDDQGRPLAEARALARVRHPNLPVVHGVDEHEGWLGMWTERVHGRTLEALLAAHGPLGAREAARVGLEVCRALEAVHAAGLVHRDVKTVNVMREESGRVVLLDFGLAIRQDAPPEQRAGGTPPSMAPELLRGERATVASDVYAVGILLYRLVSGAFPYDAVTVRELMDRQAQGESVPLRDRRPDLPVAFLDVVDRAMAPLPASRPASAGELARGLEEFLGTRTVMIGAGVTAPPRRRLPRPLTHFIGRSEELAEIAGALQAHRLVTLLGPGGCGKTRLALRAAEAVAEAPDIRVGFADFSLREDVETLEAEVRRALDLPAAAGPTSGDPLARALGEHRAFLVLDNCEHVRAAAAALAQDLLAACPRLTVLATSRAPLRVPGERVIEVPPLALPPAERAPSVTALGAFDAVRLFVARAQLVRPDFRLDDANANAVADICRRADGLPLVIELAAARSRALTPEEIRARLEADHGLLGRGDFSTSARHATLEAAIRTSYDPLPAAEQRLMDGLAVFAGSWTLEAAMHVCLDGRDELVALDLLTNLIERSLVANAPPALGASRYRFLETLRRFAHDRLAESGRLESLERRHFDYFLDLAEEAEPRLWGAEQRAWAARLEADHMNLLAALAWSRGRAVLAGAHLRLAGALARFWTERGHLVVGRESLRSALAQDGGAADLPARARALAGAGTIAAYLSEHDEARASCTGALEIYRQLGDRAGIARTLVTLGVVAHDVSDYPTADARYRESLALHVALQDTRGVANVLNNMGAIAWRMGRWDEARALLEEALEHAARAGDPGIRVLALTNLGLVAVVQGGTGPAASRMRAALALVRDHRLMRHAPTCLEVSAACLSQRHESARAARLYAAAERLRLDLGSRYEPAWKQAHRPMMDAVARDLGAARFTAETETGRALGVENALEEAARGLELVSAEDETA